MAHRGNHPAIGHPGAVELQSAYPMTGGVRWMSGSRRGLAVDFALSVSPEPAALKGVRQAFEVAMHYLPFHSLLYRYLFYGWLFRDASRGDRLEQAAALRHNRAQARWLPTYMRRWLVLGGLLFCVAVFCETVLDSPQVSTLFYVPGVLSMPINLVTAVCWLGLAGNWGDSVPRISRRGLSRAKKETQPERQVPGDRRTASFA
jgi:hypothetical protein